MALDAGDVNAASGMSKVIYDQLNLLLSPPLQEMAAGDLEKVRTGWRQLAFAVAKGVITHLESNLEIDQVKTGGGVNASVSGSTTAGGADSHTHSVSLTAVQNNIKWSQTSDGLGRVKK